jgi:hypothetical protein
VGRDLGFSLLMEDCMRGWITGSILLICLLIIVPLNYGTENTEEAGKLYDVAMELYYQGRYMESIETFSGLIEKFPTSKSVPYAINMLGQCYLRIGKYKEALHQFELYLETYPDGGRVPEAEKGVQLAKEGLQPKADTPITPSPQPPQPLPLKKLKRRVCAQIFHFNAENLEQVEKRMKDLKKAGVDTLIVRMFQTQGDRIYKFANPRYGAGVYFNSENAPVVDDLLGNLTELAHRNHLDIFAWITTRYSNYDSNGPLEYRCQSYNFETKRIEPAKGVTLFHPEVLKRLEGLFRDLGRYPIDGILFQDDLILRHNEDFNPEAAKAFLKEFGYSPHPDLFYIDPYRSESGKYYVKAYTERFWSWADWKNRWLMNVAQQLMAAARTSNPKLQFAINLYYETILNPSNAVAWFSQNLERALEKEFDYYAVMAYHRQTMRELNLEQQAAVRLMADVAEKAVKTVGDPSRVLMKIQILDWKNYEVLPAKEIDEFLAVVLAHGGVSLAFVPYVDQFPFHLLKGRWNSSQPDQGPEKPSP